ncbi:hypothetical protein [Arthrobacter flavus]|uniref:Uncharacterized protein n=1 Tax=Arthrobacter flavus TaxID=95172 RepID=A0ABW4Q7E7_9MICC
MSIAVSFRDEPIGDRCTSLLCLVSAVPRRKADAVVTLGAELTVEAEGLVGTAPVEALFPD